MNCRQLIGIGGGSVLSGDGGGGNEILGGGWDGVPCG